MRVSSWLPKVGGTQTQDENSSQHYSYGIKEACLTNANGVMVDLRSALRWPYYGGRERKGNIHLKGFCFRLNEGSLDGAASTLQPIACPRIA